MSVVTAAYRPSLPFLAEAHASLTRQRTPWEWLLQLDGPAEPGGMPDSLEADPRVRVESNGAREGVEATRNLALVRARGRFIQNLDHDDFLLEAGFDATAPVLDGDPGLGFCFGDAVDLFPDGHTEPNPDNRALAPGRIEPGALFDLWERVDFVPLHNAGVLWSGEVLRAYGGWAAVPGSGDTAAIMAVSEDFASVYVDTPTIVYRRHTGQTTETDAYLAQRTRSWACVRGRVRAMRALGSP